MAFLEAKKIANLALLILPIFELHEGQFIKNASYFSLLTHRITGCQRSATEQRLSFRPRSRDLGRARISICLA